MTSMLKKSISVILPNYNYARFIPDRIHQIVSQTYPVSELIILDDASTDNSVDIIKQEVISLKKSHPEIAVKVLVNRKNSGNVFSQWQKGIKLASSDYIWIAELDDVAKPKFLETTIQDFSNQDVVLSVAGSRFIDQNGHPVIKDNLRKIKDAFRKNLLVINTIPNVSAALFKNQPALTDFLETAKKLHLSGDWFFYIKISETGRIVYHQTILNLHRLHANSVTKTTNLKKRFSEMQAIHGYVLTHNLADEKTKKQISELEKTMKARWTSGLSR